MNNQTNEQNSIRNVLSVRDFRLLFAGTATSLLGDQFTLIATPWLVLQLTGDPVALGTVLALEGIPRALFMLFGGVITDRFSPRIIMIASDIARFVLAVLMTAVVVTDTVEMWILYAFSLGFGLVAGFAVPAANSIVPIVVEEKDLQAGNSIVMGVGQLIGFVGPVLAGILIGNYARSLWGIGLAFGIDAATFAISAIMLGLMHSGGEMPSADDVAGEGSVWSAIVSGLKYVWHDDALRLMFIVIAAVNFLFVGPILVGIPVLADQRLAEGAMAFGLLMAAFAGGNLVGFLLAGMLPRPNGGTMRLLLLALLTVFGGVLMVMGYISSTWIDFGLMLLLGIGNGYATILLLTSIQTRAPKEMLGRIMSLLMLASTGLVPGSQAISGFIIDWNLSLLFVLAGGLIVMATLWIAFQPALGTISETMLAKT